MTAKLIIVTELIMIVLVRHPIGDEAFGIIGSIFIFFAIARSFPLQLFLILIPKNALLASILLLNRLKLLLQFLLGY
jgi:hypothetical protein